MLEGDGAPVPGGSCVLGGNPSPDVEVGVGVKVGVALGETDGFGVSVVVGTGVGDAPGGGVLVSVGVDVGRTKTRNSWVTQPATPLSRARIFHHEPV